MECLPLLGSIIQKKVSVVGCVVVTVEIPEWF